MKMVTIIYDTGAEGPVEEALEKVGASGWTRIEDVSGLGRTGKRLGDPIYPGLNNIMFSVIEEEQVEPLRQALAVIPSEFIKQLSFRVFIQDCDILV